MCPGHQLLPAGLQSQRRHRDRVREQLPVGVHELRRAQYALRRLAGASLEQGRVLEACVRQLAVGLLMYMNVCMVMMDIVRYCGH